MPLLLADSITEANADHADWVVVSGSHGGLSAAHYALAVRPLLCVFNDAGIGLADAGIAGLGLLQSHHLAACTVHHSSACIGQAASTLNSGIVSHLNAQAAALGVRVGEPCSLVVQKLLGSPTVGEAPCHG
jgi:hypothetical protein